MKGPKKNGDKSNLRGCQKNEETAAERDGHLDPEQEIAAAALRWETKWRLYHGRIVGIWCRVMAQ